MTGWIVGTVCALLGLFIYLYFVWWLSQLMQRARREQTRAVDREME